EGTFNRFLPAGSEAVAGSSPPPPERRSPDKHCVSPAPETFSQPVFHSLGFSAGFDRVVSSIESSLQPASEPLALPLTSLPQMARSLVACSMLGKSSLRSQ